MQSIAYDKKHGQSFHQKVKFHHINIRQKKDHYSFFFFLLNGSAFQAAEL